MNSRQENLRGASSTQDVLPSGRKIAAYSAIYWKGVSRHFYNIGMPAEGKIFRDAAKEFIKLGQGIQKTKTLNDLLVK